LLLEILNRGLGHFIEAISPCQTILYYSVKEGTKASRRI